MQISHIPISWNWFELYFKCKHSAVIALKNEINLFLSTLGSQVLSLGFLHLACGSDCESGQRFEKLIK